MEYQRFDQMIVLRVARGEELLAAIEEVAKQEAIHLAQVHGIGACDKVTIGSYNVDQQVYHTLNYQEELELTNLTGNITTKDGKYYGHFHANFGREDGQVVGGHLDEAWVSGTAEIFLTVIKGQVNRIKDDETGLFIIQTQP